MADREFGTQFKKDYCIHIIYSLQKVVFVFVFVLQKNKVNKRPLKVVETRSCFILLHFRWEIRLNVVYSFTALIKYLEVMRIHSSSSAGNYGCRYRTPI